MGIAAQVSAEAVIEAQERPKDDRLRGWFWLTIVVAELVWLAAIGYGLSVLLT
jgi:hypothetical protein